MSEANCARDAAIVAAVRPYAAVGAPALTKTLLRAALAAQPVPAPVDPPPPVDPDVGITYREWWSQHTGAKGVTEGSSVGVIGQAGTVVEGVSISRSVVVDADDVTLRNVVIRSGARYPLHVRGDRCRVENLTIDGKGTASIAVYVQGDDFTMTAADIYGVNDGPRLQGERALIRRSWVHDLVRVPLGHHDGVQVRKGSARIEDSYLDAALGADTPDPSDDDPMNAAIMVGSLVAGPIEYVEVVRTILRGGNYSIYGGGSEGVKRLWLEGNLFRGHTQYGDAMYCPDTAWGPGNRREDGKPLDLH